jgi:23S rRNA (guanosine2251-2'-O)-methyltransferase
VQGTWCKDKVQGIQEKLHVTRCKAKVIRYFMRKLKNSELNRLSPEDFRKADKSPFIIILDNVRSLNNIGSVFRTADAFLIEKIYLCGITATPPHKDIHKTALGSTESVDWQYFKSTVDTVQLLKKNGYTVIAVEQTTGSISLADFRMDANKKYAFIFGHEIRGVDQAVVDVCDFCLDIPQYGTKHSLNISVSVGVVLWEVFRQFKWKQ